MNFQSIKLQQYLLLFSLTFILTCEDKNTDSSKFGAVHVEIVFNNDNSQNNKQSTNNGIESFTPKKELFRTIGKNIETDEVAEENIQGLHTEKDVNNSVLNKSLSGDITSITITISGVDPVNVDVSSGETVSKTIDGVPVGQQTVKIDLKDSAGTIIYTQTQTVEVTVGETSSPSFPAEDFTPENVSITVTSPNGGETWELGTTHDITWNSSHSGLNIKIELYRGGYAYQTISSSQTNDGSYSWTIPSSYNSRTDYKVRISSVADATVYDESDGNFTLAAPPSITVTSPNGGETWERGSSHSITWSSNDLPGSYVGIQLYKNGSYSSSISSSTTDDGSYTWSISSSQTESDYYQVKIYSTSESSISDYSDSYFTIEEPTSSSCNTPTNLQTYSITTTSAVLDWGSVSGAISYNIMYRENGESWYMTSDITSSGANWSGLSANTTYQWQVQSDCGSTASSWSSIITFTTPDDGGGGGSNADCDDPYYCSDCDGCEGSCCPNYCSGFYYYYNRTCDGNGFCIGATSDYCPNGCNDNGCL